MYQSWPYLREISFQIAWDYLNRSGELGDPDEAARFLLQRIEALLQSGERRRLMLSNKAIDEYKKFRAEKLAA